MNVANIIKPSIEAPALPERAVYWIRMPGSPWVQCPRCGHNTMSESKYCPDCGSRNKRAEEEE